MIFEADARTCYVVKEARLSMYLTPAYFFDIGLRSLRRNPYLNLTRFSLPKGEAEFRLLDGREGVVVILGPNTSFLYKPGRSVCRGPGTRTIPRQCPHPVPVRSRAMQELSILLRLLCGGGDVRLNRIATMGEQREILLTASEGNIVEKIDLADLARDGAPPLMFLQPCYLCSSDDVVIRSTPCDASVMSWARAPYVYVGHAVPEFGKAAILCLSGRTMVRCERLRPGESRDFALGNVIAATANIVSRLRPPSAGHPVMDGDAPTEPTRVATSEAGADGVPSLRARLRSFLAATKILFESIRAREGFLLCEMTNRSASPAYVFVQLNRNRFYGGSGLVSFFIKFVSSVFRASHVSLGH